MAEPPRHPETGDEPVVAQDFDPSAGTPRWVKVFGLIAVVLVVLFVVLLVTGRHGPSRHSLGSGNDPAPSVVHGLPGR
jgi:hypothetical protein